ncbi:MAG: CHASE2 domain-containing protein [Leptolyngbyaceae cyanobacterium bins.349]|nr:CHASE2 domain-containing protein [Leptolyngbyaceae cyanobacterium bins.349]
MSKLVILNIGEGSFEQGFPVTIQIGEEGCHPDVAETGKLPALPELPLYYSRWQSSYEGLGSRSRIKGKQITPFTLKEDCHSAAQILRARFNTWLRSEEFRPVQDTWRETLAPSEEIRVLLQTNHAELQRLPWHLWDVLDRYTKAEVGLSSPVFKSRSRCFPTNHKVHVLAILGNSEGIDTTTDRAILQQLPDAEVTLLVEPNRQRLTDHLREKPWDILFFAGHSDSKKGCGRIYLNPTDSLNITDLKYTLREAVEAGLQLAIFNSCDGLGVARDLAELQIPQTVFMREPVPDRVAQEFLKYFLTTFSKGESLYLAMRIARERLEALEDEFLYATWLPVIYQHPTAIPPTWFGLLGVDQQQISQAKETEKVHLKPLPDKQHQAKIRQKSVLGILLTSVISTAAVVGIRHLGLLQAWELQAYDQMLQARSLVQPELPDDRILVIEITDKDYNAQKAAGETLGDKSLSDTSLIRLLDILEKYKPRAIGLDLARDDAKIAPPQEVRRLSQATTLYGVCKGTNKADRTGSASPTGIPRERVGFADAPEDLDGVARRQILFMDQYPESPCQANYALSLKLALAYLQTEGITHGYTDQYLKIGNIVFESLDDAPGFYQRTNLGGSQVMLNYRPMDVPSVPLTEALQDIPSLANAVRDRIVLIGVSRQSHPDRWLTPYNATNAAAKPGVMLVAQQTSQILSSVLNNRPLLRPWHPWLEVIWIVGWAWAGGVLVWYLRSRSHQIVGIGLLGGLLWAIGFGLLNQGHITPVIPTLLVAIVTASGVVLYQSHPAMKH